MTDAFAERQREIARTYDRLAAQVTWLLGEREVDDAGVARAVAAAIRSEAFGAPFTASNRRNVILRLALLCLWRGPLLAPAFLVSGPLHLERIGAGEEKVADLVGAIRALEASATEADALAQRVRASLGEPEDLIASLWSLEEHALAERVERIRARLASDEGRALLDLVEGAVSRQAAEAIADGGATLTSAEAYVARARRKVGGAHLDTARTRLSRQGLDDALADVEAALTLAPDDPEALLLRAHVDVMRVGDLERAKQDAARALALAPGDGHAHAVVGLALQAEGESEAAAEAFSRAIDAERPYPPAYVYRGVARVDGGDVDGAAEDAEAAIRELPRAPGAYWIRGRVAARRGDRSGAMDAYETALALDPNHAATYAARADVHTAAGDHRRALADLDKAVSLSDTGTLYFNRGTVKLEMRDLDGAEADFTAALERDAEDAQAYMNRGTVRIMRGRTDAGLDDFRRGAEAAPDYAQARMKYGVMLYELGRRTEARVELEAALACAPPGWPPRAQIEGIVASIR